MNDQICTDFKEFNRVVMAYKKSSFRLEEREEFNVGLDDDLRRDFMKGSSTPNPPPYFKEWYSNIENRTRAGAKTTRVRLIGPKINSYIQYEMWIYPVGIKAGEDVRIAPRKAVWSLQPLYDFYRIDDTFIKLHYGEKGEFLGFQFVNEDAEKSRLKNIEAVVLKESISLADWLAKQRQAPLSDTVFGN